MANLRTRIETILKFAQVDNVGHGPGHNKERVTNKGMHQSGHLYSLLRPLLFTMNICNY